MPSDIKAHFSMGPEVQGFSLSCFWNGVGPNPSVLGVYPSIQKAEWKVFLPKITYSIENRKSKIVSDINEAQKLKDIAEKKLKEYEKIIEEAAVEIENFVQKVNTENSIQ